MMAGLAVFAAPATASPSRARSAPSPETPVPVPVAASDIPPLGRHLSSDRVLAIADRLPKLRAVRASHRGSYGGAYLKGPGRWQVSYFSRKGEEIGQAIIADSSGRVLEQWTGFQVAWSMARGYPGAFGRHVNALYVWLPLCALFFVPFFDWRKPLRLLHLDLLALLSFSVSLAFFNHANIGMSTPLAYPPLVYLLARMLVLARRPKRERGPRAGRERASRTGPAREAAANLSRARKPAPPLRLLVPVPALAVGVVLLLGFRITLNVIDSNVIDVGYAGVIGAQRIAAGRAMYTHYPSDNEHGDTYGPVNYESYVPFEQIFGWSGRWDDLPAAHGAAIAFDLLAVALLFLLGRRVRGPSFGIVLAYAWLSYPFTLFALESNSNDTLAGALVLAALLAAAWCPRVGGGRGPAGAGLGGWVAFGWRRLARSAWAGSVAALAGLTKFAPLALAPLLASHSAEWPWRRDGMSGGGTKRGVDSTDRDGDGVDHREDGLDRRGGSVGRRGGRLARRHARWALGAFALGFGCAGALAFVPALAHDSLQTIFERTLAYQSDRRSPFSIWGFYGHLGVAQAAVQAGAVALAVGLAVVPRRSDLVGLSAAAAAVLIAVQLGMSHWFYLYIPWFFGAAMVALLGSLIPPEAREDVASGPARSNRLAVA